MIVQKIKLRHFRNYDELELELGSLINVFLGENGQGKTNILESLSYITVFKSFRTSNDSESIQIGKDDFSINGNLTLNGGVHQEIKLAYHRGIGKLIKVNKKRIRRLTEFVGEFPSVIFSPELLTITQGAPAHRRRYIDFLISQIDKVYLRNLINYGKILKQKNESLKKVNHSGAKASRELDLWNDSLVKTGSEIISKRIEYINIIEKKIEEFTHTLTESDTPVSMIYNPGFDCEKGIEKGFKEKILKERKKELMFETTLIGPHRDEIVFKVKDRDLRKFGSQGEHKTLLLALKLNEVSLIKNKNGKQPVILLDDIFSMLDFKRSKTFLNKIGREGQIFITSIKNENTLKVLRESELVDNTSNIFNVHDGKVNEIIL